MSEGHPQTDKKIESCKNCVHFDICKARSYIDSAIGVLEEEFDFVHFSSRFDKYQMLAQSCKHFESTSGNYDKLQQSIKIQRDFKSNISIAEEFQILPHQKNFLDEIVYCYNLKDYELTIKKCNETLKQFPYHVPVLYLKALSFTILGKYDKAIEVCDEIFKIQQNTDYSSKIVIDEETQADIVKQFSDIYLLKGRCLCLLSRYEDGISCFNAALEIFPLQYDIMHSVGAALQDIKRYKEALEIYEDLFEIYPKDITVLIQRGWVLFYLEEYQKAVENSDQGLLVHKNNTSLLLMKAFSLKFLGKFEESIYNAEQILEIGTEAEYVLALQFLGEIYFEQRKYDKFYDCYDKFIKIEPNNIDAISTYAFFGYYYRNLEKKALSVAKKGLSVAPNCIECLLVTAQHATDKKNFNEVIQLLQTATENFDANDNVEHGPKYAYKYVSKYAYILLANAYVNENRIAEANVILKKVDNLKEALNSAPKKIQNLAENLGRANFLF